MSPSAPRPPRDAARTALRVLGLGTLLAATTTETLPLVSLVQGQAPGAVPGLVVVLCSQLLAAIGLLLPRPPRRLPEFALASQLAGMVQMGLFRSGMDLVGWWTPGYWAVPLLALVLVGRDRAAARRFALVILLTVQAAELSGGWQLDRPSLSDTLFLLEPVGVTLLFGEALLEAVRARDESRRRSQQAAAAHQQQELEAGARREAARMLHDHVLHALHALSRPKGLAPAELLVAECRAAHAAMVSRPDDLAPVRLEAVLADDPALATAGARLVGLSRPIPQHVAQAMAGAVHEALNNVVRHAAATTCTVAVEAHGQGVEVSVTDDGCGFDPANRPTGRLGIGRSIVARMEDVGGDASTLSHPGSGTQVRLRWPARPTTEDWRRAPDEMVRRGLTRAALPGLVVGLVMTLLWCGGTAHPVPALLVGLGSTLVGAVAIRVLLRRPLGSRTGLVLLLAALLGWGANLALVPQQPADAYLLWMAWASSTLVHLVVLTGRARQGTLAVAAWLAVQVGGLVARYGSSSLWELSSVVTSGGGEPALTLVALVITRRIVTQEAAAARQASSDAADAARIQAASQLDRYWSERVTQEALPLLRAVSEGELVPDDGEVRDWALELEATLREELVLGPQNAGLVHSLASVRSQGWSLTSTLGGDDAGPTLARAHELVDLLGLPSRAGQRVTLSATGQRASALVLGADEWQRRRWVEVVPQHGGTVDLDDDFVRLMMPVVPLAQAASPVAELARTSV